MSSHKEGSIDGDIERWDSFICHPNVDQYMRAYRFRDFRKFLLLAYVDESKKDSDAWYCFSAAVDEFNELRAKRVHGHALKTADESISAFRPIQQNLVDYPTSRLCCGSQSLLVSCFALLFFS
jgi:hypothetical protein